MKNENWPKSLLQGIDLALFFRVKDMNFEPGEVMHNEAGEIVPFPPDMDLRRAENNNDDFTEIYQREILRSGKSENSHLRKNIIEKIENMVSSHMRLYSKNPTDRDSDLMQTAGSFIAFLNDMDKPETKDCLTDPTKPNNRQIALKAVYENKLITREKGKLYQLFCWYSRQGNRTARPDPYTKVTLMNKIELFESVIKMLQSPNNQKALDELDILETYVCEFE